MTRQIVTPIQSFLTVFASKLGATTIKRIKAHGGSSQSAVTVIISRWIEKNIMLNIWLYGRICIFPLNEVGKVGKFRISVRKFQVRFTYYLFSIKA
jgi:nitrate reductase NapE component